MQTVFQAKQIVDEWCLFLIELSELKAEGIMKLENFHFATPNEIVLTID